MLLRDYTDDTAMARSVAQSLIENKGFDAKHMAKMYFAFSFTIFFIEYSK